MRWILALILLYASVAHAEKRRVVVLAFEGPSADEIRGEVVALLKRSHTVVSLDAWKRTAKSLSATKPTTVNVKRVARQLKVDAVVEGSIEASRAFRVRIRVRSGVSGRAIDELAITTKGTVFDRASERDIRDVVIDVIDAEEGARKKRKIR